MNTLFSLRTRFTLLSKPSFPRQPTVNLKPTNRLISIKPHPNPSNPNPTDYTTISALLSNPTIPPGPAFEAALDRAGIEPGPALLQQVLDDSGSSSSKQLLSLFLWAEKQPGYLSTVGILNGMVKVLARVREFEAAWCLILRRIKRGLEGPDVDTFAVLIRRYARADYGVDKYDTGTGFGHFGIAVEDIAIGTDDVYKTAEAIKMFGGQIALHPGPLPGINTKIMACLDPDGWKLVFVDNVDFLKELV